MHNKNNNWIVFKSMVENYAKSNTYIGSGNPNAQILLVGKEGSNPNDSKEANAEKNIKYWQQQLEKGVVPKHESLFEGFPNGHTWSKYQKLYDYIYENTNNAGTNFENNVFTTEMNDTPHKRTSEAQNQPDFKNNIKNRKERFFKEAFIQNFEVVVLACSNYIQNVGLGGEWEINSIFDVTWDKKHIIEYNHKKYRFDTHYNENKTKLVIHCRQLSGSIPNKYLQDMGEVIREFIQSSKTEN